MIIPPCVWFLTVFSFSQFLFKTISGNDEKKHSRFEEDEDCACGKPDAVVSRIVGGRMANPNQYPWMVVIFYDGKLLCGASLISKRYVLTAGHCVKGAKLSKLSVFFGVHDRVAVERKKSEGVSVKIEKIIIHENMTTHDVYDTYDIALLKLKDEVEFNEKILPVCLPTNKEKTYTLKTVKALGWGKVSEDRSPSDRLRVAELKVISNTQCKTYPIVGQRILDEMICTYKENVDACQGDSGGPLIFETETGKTEQIGIISWGIGCARAGLPGVFTRVTSYLDWIAEKTKGEKYCKIPP